jgi:dihydrofolate reductase
VISIVVARARNGVIGRDGALPWHLPTDMRHFKDLTTGHVVLMGRGTFESLPERFRPLPDRRNLVLSRLVRALPGAEVFADLQSALDACDRDCFVIGGGTVYREASALADRVYATEIDGDVEGDTFFTQLGSPEWRLAQCGEPIEENGLSFRFAVYERTGRAQR